MSDKGFEEVMKQNYLRTIKELVCPGCDDRLLRWPVRTCLLGHGVCRLCRNHAITRTQKVLLTLRFFATGSHTIEISDRIGISESRGCEIIKEVAHQIALLRPQFTSMPRTAEDIRKIQQKFHAMSRFPKVVGSIDCTHVRLQSPGGDNAELFRGRKGFFSRNVQCVTGPELEILAIVTRWHGSSHDQTIFDFSSIKQRLEGEEFSDSHIIADSGDRMKLCPVCNLTLIHEKSKVVDRFLKLLYHEYAKFKIDTRIKPASTKVFAKESNHGCMQPLRPQPPPVGGVRRRRRQNPPNPPLLHAIHSMPPPPIHVGGPAGDRREYPPIRDYGPPPLGPPFPRVMNRQQTL